MDNNLLENATPKLRQAVNALRHGKIVILMDDENRENEGDFVVAAEDATPEVINMFINLARGLICTPMTGKDIDRLNIPMMYSRQRVANSTAFTVSVDARIGISTGISANDRSQTIKLLANVNSKPSDLEMPGHVFPLRYQEGGVLVRAGHTEGSIDLLKLAGKRPCAAICEILKNDGTMARLADIQKVSQKYNIPIISIEDLIAHLSIKEKLISHVATVQMPTKYGNFKAVAYKSKYDLGEHLALTCGEINSESPILVRVHSECVTGDVFGSTRCDCGEQAQNALKMIAEEGTGIFIYMRQEGRGIGLLNKMKAYQIQEEENVDTVDANLKLGFPADLRKYGIGAQILKDLGVRRMKLLTNNPKKIVGLEGFDLVIEKIVPIEVKPNKNNINYLKTKRDKMGHNLRELNL